MALGGTAVDPEQQHADDPDTRTPEQVYADAKTSGLSDYEAAEEAWPSGGPGDGAVALHVPDTGDVIDAAAADPPLAPVEDPGDPDYVAPDPEAVPVNAALLLPVAAQPVPPPTGTVGTSLPDAPHTGEADR
jgi:hypothetical protein